MNERTDDRMDEGKKTNERTIWIEMDRTRWVEALKYLKCFFFLCVCGPHYSNIFHLYGNIVDNRRYVMKTTKATKTNVYWILLACFFFFFLFAKFFLCLIQTILTFYLHCHFVSEPMYNSFVFRFILFRKHAWKIFKLVIFTADRWDTILFSFSFFHVLFLVSPSICFFFFVRLLNWHII